MSLLLLFKDRYRLDTHDGADIGGGVWVYKEPKPDETRLELEEAPESFLEKKRVSFKVAPEKKAYFDEFKKSEQLYILILLKLRLNEALTELDRKQRELLDREAAQAEIEYLKLEQQRHLAQLRLKALERLIRVEQDEMLFVALFM